MSVPPMVRNSVVSATLLTVKTALAKVWLLSLVAANATQEIHTGAAALGKGGRRAGGGEGGGRYRISKFVALMLSK